MAAVWRSGRNVLLIVEDERVDDARKVMADAEPLASSRVGSGRVFLSETESQASTRALMPPHAPHRRKKRACLMTGSARA